MTQLEAIVAIAKRVASGYSGGLTFYRDETTVKNASEEGWIVLRMDWQPETQRSIGGPVARREQIGVATFEISVPKNAGLGTAYAHGEQIAQLFRGLELGQELLFLGIGGPELTSEPTGSHLCVEVRIAFEKVSLYSVATAGYVIDEDSGDRILLE